MTTQPRIHDKKPKPMFTPKKSDIVAYDFTEEEAAAGLSDPMWRLSNLYHVVNEKKEIVLFRPREAQLYLLNNLHTRNLILKSRKLGFSTQIQLLGLDTAIWSPVERVKIIALDIPLAQGIFRDTIKFAYEKLPDIFKNAAPLATDPSKNEIAFTNESIIEVTTNARGTTPTYLHVSELGKIAAKFPDKAEEILMGAITAVTENGLIFVESTAEGEEGIFYDMVQTALKVQESGAKLWPLDFKLFFYGWYMNPSYVAPVGSAIISPKDTAYFEKLEQDLKITLSPQQRAWYVGYRDKTYMGDESKMNQEQPSSVAEAFKVSMEGTYFANEFTNIRKRGGITKVPYDMHYPVNMFFDIGASDETAIWFVQAKRGTFSVIDFYEASGEPFAHFVREADNRGYVLGYVYLPHDADHRKQGQDRNLTPEEMLMELAPHWRFQLVPRTPDKVMAITQARTLLPLCEFDEEKCKDGIRHLELYRKERNLRTGGWRSTPRHDTHSNAADAFLQAAQAKAMNLFGYGNAGYSLGGAFGNDFGGGFTPEPNLDY